MRAFNLSNMQDSLGGRNWAVLILDVRAMEDDTVRGQVDPNSHGGCAYKHTHSPIEVSLFHQLALTVPKTCKDCV